MGRLTGKVAIVTGAASRGEGVGNGAATAILFAREGAKVVLVNRSAEVRLVSNTRFQASSSTDSAVPGLPIPTLLCRISSRP